MKNYTKKQRQQLLKKIIAENSVSGQEELLQILQKHGLEATQATVSRDLGEIGVSKIRNPQGCFQYTVLENQADNYCLEQLRLFFENFVVSVTGTANLLLVKTTPGNANGVASLIDRANFPGIMGTVAGDDTIIAVIDTEENRWRINGQFNEMLTALNRN